MLASAEIVDAVVDGIKAHGIEPLVVDPVFVSKSRDRLLEASAVDALKSRLVPLATLVTPNLFEAEGLLGWPEISTRAEMVDAARSLCDLGPRAVLVKGGHMPGERAVDILFDGREVTEIDGVRFDSEDTHGTGCTLSAAITARLAHGDDLLTAVHAGKEFVSGAIERALRIGKGYGPVNPGWRLATDAR
jgi:hydroxymethylpyrimidine/phosphomethylpyrimidine kinase